MNKPKTNLELYRSDLQSIWETGRQFAITGNGIETCAGIVCHDCKFFKDNRGCSKLRNEWLHETVKEDFPAYALMGGEDIQVHWKDDFELAYSAKFYGILNGKLYTYAAENGKGVIEWEYAWLPDGRRLAF